MPRGQRLPRSRGCPQSFSVIHGTTSSAASISRPTTTAGGLTTAMGRDALDGEGPQRGPKEPLDRRLKEVTKAVGGGCCRLQMVLKLALAVRETVAGRRLGAPEGRRA